MELRISQDHIINSPIGFLELGILYPTANGWELGALYYWVYHITLKTNRLYQMKAALWRYYEYTDYLSIYPSIHPSIYILSMYNIYIHIKITFFTGYFWQFQGVSPRFLEGDASDAGFNPWHGPCLDLEVSGISGWKVAWNIKKQRSRVDAGTHLGGMRLTSKFPSSKSPRLAGSC